ncbi:cyclin-domain-containing protein [Phyllosticta citricarpa]|uniref:Cyclin-domain-containing protein n=1 Tax=Phyllosticta citricarpa TaxID=55181 RepID=A0ABR1MNM7_9PEZI
MLANSSSPTSPTIQLNPHASCRSSTSSAPSPRPFTPAARRTDASPSIMATASPSTAARSPVLKRQTTDAATQYTPPERTTPGKRTSSASFDPSQVRARTKRRETLPSGDTTTTATVKATLHDSHSQDHRATPQKHEEPQPRPHPSPTPNQAPEENAVKLMPLRYETCNVKDLGVLISDMLMELVRLNDGLPLQDGQLTRFHSRAPPSISVGDYLNRLIVHATLSPPILLSMVYYIDRLCLLYPAFTISSLTVHRFLIAAATVASKGLSDSFWTNNTYARVGGVSTRELALLELEFLTRLEWRIVPKPEVLVDYYTSLVERGQGYVVERSAAEAASDQ